MGIAPIREPCTDFHFPSTDDEHTGPGFMNQLACEQKKVPRLPTSGEVVSRTMFWLRKHGRFWRPAKVPPQYVNEKRSPEGRKKTLIHKRFWRAQGLQPTQEKAKYIAPFFIHHGHWVERSGGEHVLTKAVMCVFWFRDSITIKKHHWFVFSQSLV